LLGFAMSPKTKKIDKQTDSVNIKTMLITVVISLLPLVLVFALQMPVIDILKTLARFLL
jgi:hypothetical protein